eukprot:6190521-Amphidinium_carterae.2
MSRQNQPNLDRDSGERARDSYLQETASYTAEGSASQARCGGQAACQRKAFEPKRADLLKYHLQLACWPERAYKSKAATLKWSGRKEDLSRPMIQCRASP